MQVALAGGLVDATHQFGEKFAVEVGQDHAQRVGATAAQAARGGVRRVAQRFGSSLYALTHAGGNVAVPVQGPRDGRHGDLCGLGDILDGYVAHVVDRPSAVRVPGRM